MKSLLIFAAMAFNVHALDSDSGAALAAPLSNSGTDIILCSADSSRLSVYKDDLETVKFQSNAYETILPIQVTDSDQVKTKIVEGRSVSFTQVQFLTQDDDSDNYGWVEESLLTPAGSCDRAKSDGLSDGEKMAAPLATVNPKNVPTDLKTLDPEKCCFFPTRKAPQASFLDGQRVFGFPRANGFRVHAACDIYRDLGDDVVAIDDGKVVLPLQEFYGMRGHMTYELQIQHTNGEIARYGEMEGKPIPGLKLGDRVTAGQVVGHVGFTGAVQPMLHFELYSGLGSGPLSTNPKVRGFQRRSDLINPTNLLLDWQKQNRTLAPQAVPAASAAGT